MGWSSQMQVLLSLACLCEGRTQGSSRQRLHLRGGRGNAILLRRQLGYKTAGCGCGTRWRRRRGNLPVCVARRLGEQLKWRRRVGRERGRSTARVEIRDLSGSSAMGAGASGVMWGSWISGTWMRRPCFSFRGHVLSGLRFVWYLFVRDGTFEILRFTPSEVRDLARNAYEVIGGAQGLMELTSYEITELIACAEGLPILLDNAEAKKRPSTKC